MTISKPVGLNIKAVSERTGVPLHTLRAWERRYGIPRPGRNSENHYRLYDEQDIADIVWMKRQVDAGVSPAQASSMLKRQPREMLWASANSASQPIALMQVALYDALVQRQEAETQRILSEAWSTFAPEQVVIEILQPTLRAIGEAWQQNLLSVEQEHFASNLIRQRLHAMIQAQPVNSLTTQSLVAACAPEEQHDLGLLMFSLLAKRQGWNVEYLGQRTPLSELVRAGRDAQFIVLSVSTVTGLASLVPLWQGPLPAAPILFGGSMLTQLPALREHVPGAFLAADGVDALNTLLTTAPQVSDWKPPQHLLGAALELDAARLQIAGAAVEQFLRALPMFPSAGHEFHHSLTHAALFLTDAVISALAFDVPEIMDAQAEWSRTFMPSHQISMTSLHHFLNSYTATGERILSNETAQHVHALIKRFMDALEPTRAAGLESDV